jgi:hypothetical protein
MKLHRITKLAVATAVAAAVAAPLSLAATNDRVQLAGTFVAPAQVSEAQLDAGHDPATRLVQVGGSLVAPSQISGYESGAGGTPAGSTITDSSSGFGTGAITAIAVLGAFAAFLVGSAVVLRRHRRSPAAAC